LALGVGVALALAPVARAASWRSPAVTFQPVGTSVLSAQGVGSYRGSLTVTDQAGGLSLVNRVGFQDYLDGLSEMPPTWPTAALEAQAIAARTYALWEILSHPDTAATAAQICATDSCQVYRGMAREQEPGNAAWAAAVQATDSEVLLYRDRVIEALYGSSDGGRTSYGGVPWLPSVPDPDDSLSPLDRWSWQAPLSSFGPALGIPAGSTLTGLSSVGSEVVLSLEAGDGSSSSEELSGASFHQLLNASMAAPSGLPLPLPSLNFTVSTAGTTVTVSGAGFGHGLGMSQYGALGKALRGMDAASILASYYGGLRPSRLPPGQAPASIRVGLADGLSSATIGSSGTFRVLDSAGHPLAVLGAGWWRVTPVAGGVAVSPPAPYDSALTVTPVSVVPGTLRLSLNLPAVVSLTVKEGTDGPLAVPARLLGAGTVDLPLPPGPRRGEYQVTIQADAGGGRTAIVPVSTWVGPPASAPHQIALPRPAPTQHRTVPAGPGLAALLLLLINAAVIATRTTGVRLWAPAGLRISPAQD